MVPNSTDKQDGQGRKRHVREASKSQRKKRACQEVHVRTGKWVEYRGAWAGELGVWEEERKECKRKKKKTECSRWT